MIGARRRIAASFADARKRERERGRWLLFEWKRKTIRYRFPLPLPPSTDCRCLPNKQSGERTQWGSAFLFDKTEIPCVNTVRHRGVRLPRRERTGHRIVIENTGTHDSRVLQKWNREESYVSLSLFSKINKRIIHRFLAFEISLEWKYDNTIIIRSHWRGENEGDRKRKYRCLSQDPYFEISKFSYYVQRT